MRLLTPLTKQNKTKLKTDWQNEKQVSLLPRILQCFPSLKLCVWTGRGGTRHTPRNGILYPGPTALGILGAFDLACLSFFLFCSLVIYLKGVQVRHWVTTIEPGSKPSLDVKQLQKNQ